VGIAIIGRDDREVRWVNRAAAELAGHDNTESITRNSCAQLCPAGTGECPILDHGMTVDKAERSLLRRDGSQLPVLKSVFEIEFDGERVLLETFVDIRDRKRLETELSHARKLEAVGQLAAGIAHEINTPAQFVGDSLQFLREAWQDGQGAIQAYREAVEALRRVGGHEELLARIEAADARADWEYLEENVPDSFERCFDGMGRIAAIVGAMKEFAHPDQREKTAADLNRALASTLTIARNEYKYVADLETDFGDIPPVMCHPGAVNQVFLNLIVNAAHAIGASVGDSGERGRINVRTRCDNGSVCIDIQDSGTGIPERVQDRIFEPFFTTKEVGKGSGQGLAISHSVIVDKHNGSLTFETREGEGTTFTIRLPIGRESHETTGSVRR
jgi:signal transduction histidine kinase